MQMFEYIVNVHRAKEGGYWAEVPALPGCFTQGENLSDIEARATEAIACHLAALTKRGKPLPVEGRVKGNYRIPVFVRMPKTA